MRLDRNLGLGALAAAMAFAFGCVDVVTAPDATVPLPSADLLGGDSVIVVQRDSALAEDEVVTESIGPFGGVISLPEAGLVVVVPFGAVDSTTSITVTAPAGDLVGYHFSPEGLEFDVPLIAVQDLRATDADLGGSLVAAYFEGDLSSTVEALELLSLSILGKLATFSISHFSGYVIGTN